MNSNENPLSISPRATIGLALWYTGFGAVFFTFFCIGCLLRATDYISTVWLLVFLLPAVFCLLTASLMANCNPDLSPKDSSEATDGAPDHGNAANSASLNSPPPTYKAGPRLVSPILPQDFTNSVCLSVTLPFKNDEEELLSLELCAQKSIAVVLNGSFLVQP